MMRIGELARRAEVTPDTIRFYEKERLLEAPPRSAGGYRQYDEAALEDLLFIRKARAVGLRLSEIREIMEISAGGVVPCDHVRETVTARLDEVERKLKELKALRASLRATLQRLDDEEARASGCRCGAIELA
ncbi:MAG: heavy metal-responsive transcriptional regulator [Gemmatimonadota bacterium]